MRFIRTNAPQGWVLKAVTLNGQDITDTPMEFPAGQTVTGLQVMLTKKVSSLSGLVADARGKPVLDATVVIFPADDKLWTNQSRFIKAARPDQDGTYRVTGLPPNESYLAVALQGLEDGQAGDPEFLATIKDSATKFTLGEGETKAVDVKLSPRAAMSMDASSGRSLPQGSVVRCSSWDQGSGMNKAVNNVFTEDAGVFCSRKCLGDYLKDDRSGMFGLGGQRS